MKVRASLRVKGAAGQELPPEIKERAIAAAEVLGRHGMDVLHVGRRSIAVSGEPSQFKELFGLKVEANKSLFAEIHSENAELDDLVESVEIATPPHSFE